jgi:predicted Zn-dependent protease
MDKMGQRTPAARSGASDGAQRRVDAVFAHDVAHVAAQHGVAAEHEAQGGGHLSRAGIAR